MRGVELDCPADALQLHRPDLGEVAAGALRFIDNLLGDQHFARSGILRDAGRDVHGPPEVVPFLEQDGARVQADVGWREPNRANTIDHVIETTPNEARYFVGYVGWRPGELKTEIDRGLWSVQGAEVDMVFRKDTENLWEELQQQAKRIRAEGGVPAAAPAPLAVAR